ncbi:molybdate transport repressor [Campylobacter concisus]|uniref:molybdate transport repressor n=1 Tax=Campylobacter concisus TaxID=199 RepID=UPI000B3D6B20|nr:molybdate transport repressor [Campylobacter concisus]MBE9818486.1 molybdate transport repressor [Campylobacter concisus]OUT14798.1 molybdate transport repressor [Campylobacter concisus]
MITKESKKDVFWALAFGLGLFIFSIIGYFYLALGTASLFGIIIGALSAFFCVRKIFQNNFLRIEDDGFIITKGSKSIKFYFKDIDEIAIKSFGDKKKVETLSVKFKKNRLDRDACFGLVQPLGDDLIIIFDKYELSKFTISKELRDRLNNFRA